MCHADNALQITTTCSHVSMWLNNFVVNWKVDCMCTCEFADAFVS